MLLATEMILVGIFTEVCSGADGTGFLVGGFGCCGGRGGLGLEDLLGEDFGGNWREGGNTAL